MANSIKYFTISTGEKQPREAIYLLNIMILEGFVESHNFLLELSEVYLDHFPVKFNENAHLRKNVLVASKLPPNLNEENLEWNQRLLLMEGMSCISQSLAKSSCNEVIRYVESRD